MATLTRTAAGTDQDRVEQKIRQLRDPTPTRRISEESRWRTGSPLSNENWQQGLGAHRELSVRERGSEAASRPAAATGRQLPGPGRGGHGPRHSFRCSWTTKRSCSSPPPTMASGTPTSMTSRRIFPTLWICCSAMPSGGLGFGARRRKTGSSNTRSRRRPGTSPDGGGDPTA
jgi:hypothetical protein